jgi:hypothetical protein
LNEALNIAGVGSRFLRKWIYSTFSPQWQIRHWKRAEAAFSVVWIGNNLDLVIFSRGKVGKAKIGRANFHSLRFRQMQNRQWKLTEDLVSHV